jgi:microcystin-dependent protein
MANQYLGEIRMFGSNFPPKGWALCNGQIMSIAQNTALFSLLGTFYGGDGVTTFALPNLQGRFALHWGSGGGSIYSLGQLSGSISTNILTSNLPSHNHALNGVASGGNQPSPVGALPAIESTGTSSNYSTAAATGQMNATAIGFTGSGLPLSTMPPYLCVTFIIALQGIFPSRN